MRAATVLPPRSMDQRGSALALALHVLLLVLVLGQIVFLASRHRLRIDLTSDRVWTSTASTRAVLDKLDKRLLIEAYFSPKESLPASVREARTWADNFLDEIVQLGRGRVVLRRFDPNADKAVTDKATRLGVQPLNLQSRSATSLSVDQHWLGLRLEYGGDKQKVLPQFAPASSFVAEAILTPAIKEVITREKRRLGYMEWPCTAVGSQQPGGIGWNTARTHEGLAKRYEFQNLKDADGALVPAEFDTLFLFGPRDLTDRQKYVLDQFVLRGGVLVVFADAVDYAIGPQRLMTKLPFAIDAAGSEVRFVDQLAHYGLDWQPRLLADMAAQAHTPRDRLRGADEYFAFVQPNAFRFRQALPVPYPYFFHAVHTDWAKSADDLARVDGKVDEELARRYRELFVPGMPADDFLFQSYRQIGRGPGFYWPTWAGLRRKAGNLVDLPPGVEGRVLLWSSPAVLIEDPPQLLNPIGRDPAKAQLELNKFNQTLTERFRAEPRQQAPLMAEVKGRFTSYFAGRERPRRPSEIQEEEARSKAATAPEGDDPPELKPVDDLDLGPPPPKADGDAPAAPQEPAMVVDAALPGRIVLVGDATFLRDDVLRGDHRQAGGPVSGALAMPFFAQLLDWLSEDRDLVALQSRSATDRTLRLLADDPKPGTDPRVAEQALRARTSLVRGLNIALPIALLGGIWAVVAAIRRAQKRRFLGGLANGGAA